MNNDFTMQLTEDVLQKRYTELQQQGLSEDEIRKVFSKIDFGAAMTELTETISSDHVDFFEKTMYERVLQERAQTDEFMSMNRQIWEKGFVVSEAMYLIALEMGNDINAYASTLATEQYKDIMFRYCVLGKLYGRACQQYLEILYLLKGGFADGAYARWRSLFELSVISEFIRKNDEDVAKAYYCASFTDDGRYGWAGVAPCFSKWKNPNRITFDKIKEQCSMSTDAWNNQYRTANKIVHATPQGTFDRLGMPFGPQTFTPAGHSDYGLASPAINAAISLSMIASDYFGFVSSGDAIVYMKTLTKWANVVKKYYIEIEETHFDNKTRNEHTQPK